MSLIEELRTRGVTVEDLERAAAVRLFEKTAAAENVDLDLLSVEQVNDLFQRFITPSTTKEASDMDYDTAVELFEKTAAAENIDLENLDDEGLTELFEHFVNEVLPQMMDDGAEKEAAAQLDEAELLGRHMARAYMDELEKAAASPVQKQIGKNNLRHVGSRIRELLTGHEAAAARAGARLKQDAVSNPQARSAFGEGVTSKHRNKVIRNERLKGYAKRVGVVGGAGAAAMGGKALMDKKASSEEVMAEATYRANQFLEAGTVAEHDGSFIDDLALDILADHGYSWGD